MNHRFQGSVQAENGLGINTCLAKFSCSLLGKPTRTMTTNLNQPAGCEETLVVGGCPEGRGNSVLISPSRPQPPQQRPLHWQQGPFPCPISLLPFCTAPCPWSLPKGWNTGSLGSTTHSRPRLSAGPTVSDNSWPAVWSMQTESHWAPRDF